MSSFFKKLFYLLGEERSKIPRLVFLFICISILDLVGLGLITPFIALVFNPSLVLESFNSFGFLINQEELLAIVGFLLIMSFAFKAVFGIWINYQIIKFSQVQQVRLRSQLMHSYQTLPYTKFLAKNSSNYIYTILTLVGQFTSTIIQSSLRIVSESIVSIFILFFLAWNNWQVLLILVIILLILVITFDLFFSKKLKIYGKLANMGSVAMVQGIHEGMEGLKEIRVLGYENYFYEKVKKGSEQQAEMSAKSQIVSTLPRYFLEFSLILFIVLVILITTRQGENVQSILTTISLFGVASLRLIPSANLISSGMIQLRLGKDSMSRLYNDLKEVEKVGLKSKSGIKKEIKEFQSIVLNNISYKYPGASHSALKGVNLKIKSGELIGVIGASGSGKTTLVDLLLGLLSPTQGRVLINNNLFDENKRHMAYLPQQVFMIDDTLRNNIALGVTDQEIDNFTMERAIQQASLESVVKNLPNGLDTVMGERGVRLSGGQRQRVALARAFYHKRDVLVMDESTSALDKKTEASIVKEMCNLKGKITIIIIAHSYSTIQHCDRVYHLNDGRIIESGAPSKILNLK
jgi:ATP-binding cassette, subfamily B, bacterial PglK